MANALYPKWKEALLQASASSALNGTGATGVYAVLVDTGTYTYNAAHQFYSDLSGLASTTAQEIDSGKTYTNGVFDGVNITWPSVTAGNSCEAVVLYIRNAGANTTWRLAAYLDTGVTGLPITPNGGDIAVTWDASGIFGL